MWHSIHQPQTALIIALTQVCTDEIQALMRFKHCGQLIRQLLGISIADCLLLDKGALNAVVSVVQVMMARE